MVCEKAGAFIDGEGFAVAPSMDLECHYAGLSDPFCRSGEEGASTFLSVAVPLFHAECMSGVDGESGFAGDAFYLIVRNPGDWALI